MNTTTQPNTYLSTRQLTKTRAIITLLNNQSIVSMLCQQPQEASRPLDEHHAASQSTLEADGRPCALCTGDNARGSVVHSPHAEMCAMQHVHVPCMPCP